MGVVARLHRGRAQPRGVGGPHPAESLFGPQLHAEGFIAARTIPADNIHGESLVAEELRWDSGVGAIACPNWGAPRGDLGAPVEQISGIAEEVLVGYLSGGAAADFKGVLVNSPETLANPVDGVL